MQEYTILIIYTSIILGATGVISYLAKWYNERTLGIYCNGMVKDDRGSKKL